MSNDGLVDNTADKKTVESIALEAFLAITSKGADERVIAEALKLYGERVRGEEREAVKPLVDKLEQLDALMFGWNIYDNHRNEVRKLITAFKERVS